MSEILANIVVEPVELVITAENNQINFTPNDIQLNIYTAGQGSGGAGGNLGELQFNNGGTIGGAANTFVNANGNVRFTNISNLKINGGSTGYYLQTDGSGNLTWAVGTANVSGNGTSAGSNNQIQLSDGAGNFKVGAGFSFDPSSNILAVPGNVAATNFLGTFANGTSNIAIATNSNINLTVNGNVSAVVSDNKLTVPSLTVNSSNVTLGVNAGANSQSANAIAIGNTAGFNLQGANAIAIGFAAASNNQGYECIAIGTDAGSNTQGNSAIAIGYLAGDSGQGQAAVAIGPSAGEQNQGEYSVAIGYRAGKNQISNNSIIINAANANLDGAIANAFYVKPIRQANSGNVLYYDQATGEIVYDIKPDTNSISNGSSNVTIASANSNITMGVNGTANVVVVSQNGVNVTGNLSGTTILGNVAGPLINGTSSVSIPSANGNIALSVGGTSNVVVATNTGVVVNNTANITGNLNASNVNATGIFANTLAGLVTTASQPNITSVGNLLSLTVTGNTVLNSKVTIITGVEPLGVNTSAPTGTVNLDISNNSVTYYDSTAATGNISVNLRGNASLNFSSVVTTNSSAVATLIYSTGATAYSVANLSIDSIPTPIYWSGGASPNVQPFSIMSYTFTALRSNIGYVVLGTGTRYS